MKNKIVLAATLALVTSAGSLLAQTATTTSPAPTKRTITHRSAAKTVPPATATKTTPTATTAATTRRRANAVSAKTSPRSTATTATATRRRANAISAKTSPHSTVKTTPPSTTKTSRRRGHKSNAVQDTTGAQGTTDTAQNAVQMPVSPPDMDMTTGSTATDSTSTPSTDSADSAASGSTTPAKKSHRRRKAAEAAASQATDNTAPTTDITATDSTAPVKKKHHKTATGGTTDAPATDNATAPVTDADPNAPLLNAKSVGQFISALPDWDSLKVPEHNRKTDTTTPTDKAQHVSRSHVSLGENPDTLVTDQPVEGFWLGAIVQRKGVDSLGTLREIQIDAHKRASFKVTSDLPITPSYEKVKNPSVSKVGQAISTMEQAANKVPCGSSFSTNVADNFNATQTAVDLGLDVNFLTEAGNFSLNSALGAANDAEHHTVTMSFTQKAYTMQVDLGGRTGAPAFFNDTFTPGDARALVSSKQIGMDNPPAYVKSITYGRVVLVNVTSDVSESKVNAALQVSGDAGVASGTANTKIDNDVKNATYQVTATEVGGNQESFAKLLPKGDIHGYDNMIAVVHKFVHVKTYMSEMKPISYQLNTVKENLVAAIPLTTEYDVEVHNPLPKHKLVLWVTIEKGGIVAALNDIYGEVDIDHHPYWKVSSDNPVKDVAPNTDFRITDDTNPIHFMDGATKMNSFDAIDSEAKPLTVQITLYSRLSPMGLPLISDEIFNKTFSVDGNLDSVAAETAGEGHEKKYQQTRQKDVGVGFIHHTVDQYAVTLHWQVEKE